MIGIRHIAVVIPAADEEDLIGTCLHAVARSRQHLRLIRPEISVSVSVVLDRCTDRTAAIVQATSGVDAYVCGERNVGRARHVGTRAAVRAAGCRLRSTWTAHTDADSVVPSSWLFEHVRRAECGSELLLGTIQPELAEPLLSMWRAAYWDHDGHRHVHGTNLGVRADVLAALGGWPQLRTGEDVGLVARAEAAGVRIARVGNMAVATSARRKARAPRGFSHYLNTLAVATTAQSERSGLSQIT